MKNIETRPILTHFGTKQLKALDKKAEAAGKSRASYLRGLVAKDTGVADELPGNRWGQGRR